jgi:hypothetical protein
MNKPSESEGLGDMAVHCQWSRDDNAWLQNQGVISLKSLWAQLAPRCSSHRGLNRLVRTRMPGGVGRAVSNGRPYPI